jgi:hypothetical protein
MPGTCPICKMSTALPTKPDSRRWDICTGCSQRGLVVFVEWSDGYIGNLQQHMKGRNEKIHDIATTIGWPGRTEDFYRIAYGITSAPNPDRGGEHPRHESRGPRLGDSAGPSEDRQMSLFEQEAVAS